MKKILFTISLLCCFSYNLFAENIHMEIRKFNLELSGLVEGSIDIGDYFGKNINKSNIKLDKNSKIIDLKMAVSKIFNNADIDLMTVIITVSEHLNNDDDIKITISNNYKTKLLIKPQYNLKKLLNRDFSSLEKYLRDAITKKYYNNDLQNAENNWHDMDLYNRVQLLYRIDFNAKYEKIPNLLSDKAYKHYKLQNNGIYEDDWMNSNEEARKNILKKIFDRDIKKLLNSDFSSLEKYLRDTIAQKYYDNDLEIAEAIWNNMNPNERLLYILVPIDFNAKYDGIPNLLSNEAHKYYKLQNSGINKYFWTTYNEKSKLNFLKNAFKNQ